jgi:hypothetical protein
MWQHHFMWWCYNEKGNGSFCRHLFFVFEKKKTTIMNCRLLLWWCSNKEGDNNKLSLPSSLRLRRRRQ